MVRLGDQNLAKANDGAQPVEYDIEKPLIEHEDYNMGYRTNDIALIKLAKNVIFTDFIRPACLHQGGEPGEKVIAVNIKICSLVIDYNFILIRRLAGVNWDSLHQLPKSFRKSNCLRQRIRFVLGY